MGERQIENLDGMAVEPDKDAVNATATIPIPLPRPEVLVDVNYPEPTQLSVVIRDVAKWSGQCFVMEPSVNGKIQIFAPHRQTLGQAYELFLASLSVVGLRAVQVGHVVKIVPVTLVVSA